MNNILYSSQASQKPPIMNTNIKNVYQQKKFSFIDYELAFQVRQIVYEMLIGFDLNKNLQFEEDEVKQILKTVLQENQLEIRYVTKNVFRYDSNNDGIISYDQFVTFFTQHHFGEIAIQRLHKQSAYKMGKQRKMDCSEFIRTILFALSYIKVEVQNSYITQIFKVIDIDQDQFISYEDYFRFLKEYFGSKSFAAKIVKTNTVVEQYEKSLKEGQVKQKGLSPRISPQKGSNRKDVLSKYKKYIQKSTQVIPKSISKRINLNFQNKQHSPRKNSRQNIKILKQRIKLTPKEEIVSDQIARLVYSQLRVYLMNYDDDFTLKMNLSKIKKAIKELYKVSQEKANNILNYCNIQPTKQYSYEEVMKVLMSEYIHRLFTEGLNISDPSTQKIKIQDFIYLLNISTSIVKANSIVQKFEALFYFRKELSPILDYADAMDYILHIFSSYNFNK